jgi:uncharacterized membrane protein YphA (DoxX/SURF4 family)
VTAYRTTAPGPSSADPDTDFPVDARLLARGLAVVRILLGLTFFSNGLAKLFGFREVVFGPVVANLINRPDARFILDVEVNKNAQRLLPPIRWIANDLVLPNFGFFGWALTVVELVAGLLLILGLLPRIGALLALGPVVFLFFVYLSNDRWLPERFVELVPLLVLAVVPSGYAWGLDGRLGRRPKRWPL